VWISERKDVLSLFFFCLLGLLAYRATSRSPPAQHGVGGTCLALGFDGQADGRVISRGVVAAGFLAVATGRQLMDRTACKSLALDKRKKSPSS